MVEKEARNFALRDAKGNEEGVFTGRSPRQAALKAANRGVTDIRLRYSSILCNDLSTMPDIGKAASARIKMCCGI